MKYNKRKGFTLAEVLITLTIIGIVASLTIPTLINSIGDQQNKIAWKKAFAEVSQATMRIVADNGGSLNGLFTNSSDVKNEFSKYFNYVKSCNNNETDGCWHQGNSWKLLNGTAISYSDGSGIILNSGTLLRFAINSQNCTYTNSSLTNICGLISFDINGFKDPNTIGKDIFYVWIQSDNITPFGARDTYVNTCTATTSGHGCSTIYLYQ